MVGRYGRFLVLHAEAEHEGLAGYGLLVPVGPQGCGLQRPDHHSRQRQEPCACAPLPRLDDDLQELDAQLLLEWLSATAAKGESLGADHDQELLHWRTLCIPVVVRCGRARERLPYRLLPGGTYAVSRPAVAQRLAGVQQRCQLTSRPHGRLSE